MSDQQLDTWKPPGGDIDAYQAPPPGQTTPQQARVEAVSTLLHAAYQKASTLELTPEEDEKLSQDFPDEAFKNKAGGNPDLIYIEHAFLRDRFNSVFGRGKWTLVRTRPHWAEDFRTAKGEAATRIYAEAALLIRGCYVGEAIGEMVYYPNNATQNYGDAAEGAMTAAFRRCAKNFGVGLQAWKKDFGEGWKKRTQGGTRPAQQAPAASASAQQQASAPKPAAEPQARPAATAQQATGGSTAKTRDWMLTNLTGTFSLLDLQNFAVANKIVPQGGVLSTAWPLTMVPPTGDALRALRGQISAWLEKQKPPVDPDQPPLDDGPPAVSDDQAMDEGFWCVKITVPRPGMKGDAARAYKENPDTIQSLYNAMKGGDEAARTRIWGLAKQWAPSTWVDAHGATRQPSELDIKCREGLDAFLDWHEKKGGE